MTEWHTKQIGERNTLALETAASNRIKMLVDGGLRQGLTEQAHLDLIQDGIKELAYRKNGGVADIPYKRLEEITLQIYRDIAEKGSPDQAARVVALTQMPRKDPLTDQTLGAMQENPKLNDKVDAIQKAAIANIQKAEEKEITETVRDLAKQAILNSDGSSAQFEGTAKVRLRKGTA